MVHYAEQPAAPYSMWGHREAVFTITNNLVSTANPRREAEEHYYNPSHTGLLSLGLQPHYLTDEVLAEMLQIILTFKNNIDKALVYPEVQWG